MPLHETRAVRKERLNGRGEVWAVWWECDNCNGHVSPQDIYCRWCGKRLR